MESQPQNPEFRNNPENFHPCNQQFFWLGCFPGLNQFLEDEAS